MPSKPLVVAGIESLLSTFPYRSPALRTTRSHPLGRVLRVEVKSLSTPSIPVFNERQVDILDEWVGDADCTATTYANVLPKLCDRQQLTALVRNGELEMQGGIQVMQNFVAPADLTEFDPAGLLIPYTGNIAAEGISRVLRGGAKLLRYGIKYRQCYVTGVIIEERRIAPGPLEVVWFTGETAVVERTVDTLTKRLEGPEAK